MYHGGILSVRSHQICHSDLQYDSMGPDGMYKEDYCFGREMVRLGVLRSCRQIYVEANNILWTTNTFSFADATTLKRFMMTRTINQKHSIKSIRLQMAFEIYEWEKEWNTALSMPLVRSLSGLRCLRLSIEYEMKAKNYNSAKPTTSFLTPPIVKVYTRSRPCHWLRSRSLPEIHNTYRNTIYGRRPTERISPRVYDKYFLIQRERRYMRMTSWGGKSTAESSESLKRRPRLPSGDPGFKSKPRAWSTCPMQARQSSVLLTYGE